MARNKMLKKENSMKKIQSMMQTKVKKNWRIKKKKEKSVKKIWFFF